MVRYIKANQTEEFRESNRGLNAKDVWLENFDGTSKSVNHICKILGIEREDIVEAYIPNGVTKLGEYVFCNCTFLTSITIPDSVTSIENYAFAGCTSLTSVTIGTGVKSIGGHAFAGCTSLTSVTIPNSVTRIGAWAFAHCKTLTRVTIGNSVTNIGRHAFIGCTSLIITTNNPYVVDFCIDNDIDYIDVSPSR